MLCMHTWVERTVSMCKYPTENVQLSLTSYHLIPLGTAPNHSFPVRLKIKRHGTASVLCAFEPSAPRLQQPRSKLATNLVDRQSHHLFFALDHTHCHHTAQAQLSSNHMQPLNNAKFRTATTSLRSPFHLDMH